MSVGAGGRRRGASPEIGKGTHGEVTQVDGRPGDVLGHAGNSVDDNFASCNKHDVDHPCTYMNAQRDPFIRG